MKAETETKPATEIWEVMAGEEVYQADLQTLKQWIGEGLVQPTDKVRKGSLKWIEGGRAPMLRPRFTGAEPPPPDEAVEFEARPAADAFEPTSVNDAFEPAHANVPQPHADAAPSQARTHGASSPANAHPAPHAPDAEG